MPCATNTPTRLHCATLPMLVVEKKQKKQVIHQVSQQLSRTWKKMLQMTISQEAREKLEMADVIIAKGQGNFETIHTCGLNIYYLFLCKCDWFMQRFHAKHLQGMFVNETRI